MEICQPAISIRRFAPVTYVLSSVFLALGLLSVAPSSVRAQRTVRVRPAFEPKLVKRQTVSGFVRFRIVPRRDGLPHEFAPIGYGGWVAVIRIDGHILASRTRLPAVIEWDTRKSGDGIHEVHVAVRNARADQEVGVEGAQLIVDNAAADTAAEAAAISRRVRSGGSPPSADDPAVESAAPVLTLPERAEVKNLSARFSRSPNPLATRVTALLRSGAKLYLGLPDGGIAFCAPDSGAGLGGSVVRLPYWDGRVQSLAAGGGSVWWVTESGRSVYAYRAASHTVAHYDVTAALTSPPLAEPPREGDSKAETEMEPDDNSPVSVPASPPAFIPAAPVPLVSPGGPSKRTGWVRRLLVLRGHVLLLGDAGMVRVLDPRSGKLADGAAVDALLPEGIRANDGEAGAARLFASATGDSAGASALVVSITPSSLPEPADQDADTDGVETITDSFDNNKSVTAPRWRRYLLRAWRFGRDEQWHPVASFSTDADPERAARLAVAPDALATAEREGLRLVKADSDLPKASELPYDLSPGMPSSTERVALGPSGLWWEQRGIIFRADSRTGTRDAFLPWNVSSEMGAVLALAADDSSVWVATTSAGVRRIRPGRPSANDGYNGYIRARLGAGTLRPPTQRDSRIASAIDIWQGVPYVWGGQSRSGADCSGFVMRMHQVGGVSIPRTSSEMRHSSQGKRIRDELRWGDTLVYPGHCAIYIGDGQTAETVGGTRGGSVSHSSVWVRSSVIVRRFLK